MLHNTIENSENLAIILIVVMFLLSGISKTFTFNEAINSLKQKLSLSIDLYKFIIMAVILLEILAPLFIINYMITGKQGKYAYYSIIGLLIFTILATLLYHLPDFTNYKKSIPFWANVSLIGGLLLATKIILNKISEQNE